MRHYSILSIKLVLVFFIAILFQDSAYSQVSRDYALELSATTDASAKTITINWASNSSITDIKFYLMSKDTKGKNIWIPKSRKLNGSFVLDSVEIGKKYEIKAFGTGKSNNAYGYITTGIQVADFTPKGLLVLLVDDSCATKLPNEVKRLESDLIGEGWTLIKQVIQRKTKVSEVKATLLTIWNQNNKDIKGIFLLGRIPVPYSGFFAPDGHPDHRGAWPADVYYTSLNNDGDWTDFTELTTASRTENKNYNGDGKFDNDFLPGPPDAFVGRVDLSNMPGFALSETGLMKRYLDRDHNFRTGQVNLGNKGILCDNFGAMGGEAFAASGYKAFSPIIGSLNVDNSGVYATKVKSNTYLMTYGTGGGWYTGASGIGASDSFFTGQFKGAFNMLFGSYFGDWDYQNSFLRSPLAADGYGLTCVWSGRPHWIMHQLGLGATFGECAKISQYDTSMYFRHPNNAFGATRQIALMGDPTLTVFHNSPIQSLNVSVKDDAIKKQSNVVLNWKGKSANGYLLYKSRILGGAQTLLTPIPIIDSTFTDLNPIAGKSYYIVKSVQLTSTPSGSYYNPSTGLIDSATTTFGVGIESLADIKSQISIYPNPANDIINIQLKSDLINKIDYISIYQIDGKLVRNITPTIGSIIQINISDLSAGLYQLKIQSQGRAEYFSVVKGE